MLAFIFAVSLSFSSKLYCQLNVGDTISGLFIQERFLPAPLLVQNSLEGDGDRLVRFKECNKSLREIFFETDTLFIVGYFARLDPERLECIDTVFDSEEDCADNWWLKSRINHYASSDSKLSSISYRLIAGPFIVNMIGDNSPVRFFDLNLSFPSSHPYVSRKLVLVDLRCF